ncbi:hypothetical protein GOP47_0016117, partial [Adiantum capillus-veneris]
FLPTPLRDLSLSLSLSLSFIHMVSSQQATLAAMSQTPPICLLRIPCRNGEDPHCRFSSLPCGEHAMPLASLHPMLWPTPDGIATIIDIFLGNLDENPAADDDHAT